MGRYKTNLVEPTPSGSGAWKWVFIALVALILIWVAIFGTKLFVRSIPSKKTSQEILRKIDNLVEKVASRSDSTDSEYYATPLPRENTEKETPQATPTRPRPALSPDSGIVTEVNGYAMTGVTIERNAPPTVYLKRGNSTRSFTTGDKFDDYTIVEIHRFHILLDHNGQRIRMEFPN
jgi:cytoskeletal protein RodZ